MAGTGILLFSGAVAFQLLVTGLSHQQAEGAAHAGAIAIARGEAVGRAVERSLPGWAVHRHRLYRSPGRVEVRIRPPAPVAQLSRLLEVSSTAWSRGAGP
ncbi:MAG: hypothetical protein ACO3ZZ_08770 [Solirubrobacterales bacterium]